MERLGRTQTILRHRKTREPAILNFAFANKLQRKFSPLYLKHVPADWPDKTALQLPNYVERNAIDCFRQITANNVADFCLDLYRAMGLLTGIRVARSGDPAFRRAACDITDLFADVPFQGEIVRARLRQGRLMLHEGGDAYVTLPETSFTKEQVSPTRDSRLRWMQSVLHCTHYIAGAGEKAYLHPSEAPDVTFIERDHIDDSHEAFTEISA